MDKDIGSSIKYEKIWGDPKRKSYGSRRNFVVSNGIHIKDIYERWTFVDWLWWVIVWRWSSDPFFNRVRKVL